MAGGNAKRLGFMLGALLVAGVALIAAACGGSDDDSSTEAPPAPTVADTADQVPTEPVVVEPTATESMIDPIAPEPTEADPMDGPGSALPTRIEIEARDNFFVDIQPGVGQPGRIEAPANTEITVKLTNEGVLPHNITFASQEGGSVIADGANGSIILEGESSASTFETPDPGTYYFFCAVHPLEMIGEFVVR